MATRKANRVVAIAALTLSTLITLSACGGDDSAGGGGAASSTFDFESDLTQSWTTSESPVEIIMSEDLLAVVPEDAPVSVERFLVTSDTLDASLCRVDVEISYTDGGLDQLQKGDLGDPEANLLHNLLRMRSEQVTVGDTAPDDDSLQEGDMHLTEENTHLTVAEPCSLQAEGSGPLVTLWFDTYSSADVAVTEDGEFGIFGWTWAHRNHDGEWAAPDQ